MYVGGELVPIIHHDLVDQRLARPNLYTPTGQESSSPHPSKCGRGIARWYVGGPHHIPACLKQGLGKTRKCINKIMVHRNNDEDDDDDDDDCANDTC